MFQKARIKLTAWYLLIIMLISIAFSVAIYQVVTSEFNRVERAQRMRRRPAIDPEVLQESENRLGAILILINLFILGAAGISGYFLAGRTLKPIKEMIDDQNRFITDASHELRTPLTSLKSEIEVNLRDEKLNLKDAKHLLQSNLEEVNNLQALSDNLIKLTQNQKINTFSEFSQVSLKVILDEAVKKVAVLAKHKNIQIENITSDFVINADSQSLVEVFVILLDNAIKYSSTGKKIKVTVGKTDGSVKVDVTDQGIGISPEDLPHLFDRFYRVDKSRTKLNVDGFGLGLSIAKQIVESHGGSIKVSSKVGEGTTFSIHLPV